VGGPSRFGDPLNSLDRIKDFARVGSLERVMHPGSRTAGCLSIVEPRATRLEITRGSRRLQLEPQRPIRVRPSNGDRTDGA
jgi:hypothetical protein